MASARKVELDCEGSFSEAAARTVAVRSKEVFERANGILNIEEVERVHDMRVATRRLRAALEIFESCFPRKRYRKTLKRVKVLADALGERRDVDVEIELLESLASEAATEDRASLEDLIDERRRRQHEANEALAVKVTPKRLKKLRQGLKKLAKAAE